MSSISILPIFYLNSTIHVVTEICISVVIDSEAYLIKIVDLDNEKNTPMYYKLYC